MAWDGPERCCGRQPRQRRRAHTVRRRLCLHALRDARQNIADAGPRGTHRHRPELHLTLSEQPQVAITVANPVIPGFHPDPSVSRVGEDYYLACSSFECFPGVPVFHRRDLMHWTQIGNAPDRPGQLRLLTTESSGGVYAPTPRHHDGRFWLITTNFSDGGHPAFHRHGSSGVLVRSDPGPGRHRRRSRPRAAGPGAGLRRRGRADLLPARRTRRGGQPRARAMTPPSRSPAS